MSIYQIDIDDKAVTEQINRILDTIINREINNRYSTTSREISVVVKDVVYSHKDEIIEKVVDRATREIIKKGLPKLLEKDFKND